MKPATAYRRLNKMFWLGQLPNATIVFVDNETIPRVHGITLLDRKLFRQPVICLNRSSSWPRTLVHEMIHIAEPMLFHGPIFTALENFYWKDASRFFTQIQKQETANGK